MRVQSRSWSGRRARSAAVAIAIVTVGLLVSIPFAAPPSGSSPLRSRQAFLPFPIIILSSTSGSGLTSLSVTGVFFTPNTTVNLSVSDSAGTSFNISNPPSPGSPELSNVFVNASGDFTASSLFIGAVSLGVYTVRATDGILDARAPYQVTSSGVLLSSSASSGSVGSSVTLTGTGFYPTDLDYVYFANNTSFSKLGSASSNITGAVSATISVPSVAPGPYVIALEGLTSSFGAVNFTVTPPPPTVSLTPSSGALGSTVQLSGAHFTPGGSVWVNASPSNGGATTICGGSTATSSGTFACEFTDPSTAGATFDLIHATDNLSGRSASSTFTILNSSLSLFPTSLQPGAIESPSVLGFAPGSTVNVQFTKSAGGCVITASANGSGTCSFELPFVSPGTALLTAVGSQGTSAAATLAVLPNSISRFPAYLLQTVPTPSSARTLSPPTSFAGLHGWLLQSWSLGGPAGREENLSVTIQPNASNVPMHALLQLASGKYHFSSPEIIDIDNGSIVERGVHVSAPIFSYIQLVCKVSILGRALPCPVSSTLSGGAGSTVSLQLVIPVAFGTFPQTGTDPYPFPTSPLTFPAYLYQVAKDPAPPTTIGGVAGAVVTNFSVHTDPNNEGYLSVNATTANQSDFAYMVERPIPSLFAIYVFNNSTGPPADAFTFTNPHLRTDQRLFFLESAAAGTQPVTWVIYHFVLETIT